MPMKRRSSRKSFKRKSSMRKTVNSRPRIASVRGRGDYTGGGKSMIRYNILTNKDSVPKFASDKIANIVTHREYIGDVVTGPQNTFTLSNYLINPGLAATFPWLSTIAQNYEEYKFHGIIFEYKTTSSDALNSTNTALGTVIMATSYNASNPNFTTKQQMENYEFAQSAKPSLSQMHGVECARMQTPVGELYTRVGAVPAGQDERWYDLGNFQIATSGFQAAGVVIGELWVTYCVEFLKPKIPQTIGGTQDSLHIRCVPITGAYLTSVTAYGNIAYNYTSTVLTLTGLSIGQKFLLTNYTSSGTSFTPTSNWSSTIIGANGLSYFVSDTVNNTNAGSGTSTTCLNFIFVTTGNTVGLTAPLGTIVGAATGDIFIQELDSTITA